MTDSRLEAIQARLDSTDPKIGKWAADEQIALADFRRHARADIAYLLAIARAAELMQSALQEVIDKSGPQPIGGQQVTPMRYQMTPSTRKELQRIVRNFGAPPTSPR